MAPVTTSTNRTLTLAQFNQALSNGSASGQPATAESLSNSTLALAMVGALLLARLLSHTCVGSALQPTTRRLCMLVAARCHRNLLLHLITTAWHAASCPCSRASALRGAIRQTVPSSTACSKVA